MSPARTTGGISRIPGVSTFRSTYQPPAPERQVVGFEPCGKCCKEFKRFPDTPWDEVIQNIVEHVRLCERITKELVPGKKKRRGLEEEKNDKRVKDRQRILQQDPWTALVEPTQVRCGACGALIQLDKRRAFYPGLWNNHRARCTGIDSVFDRAEQVLRSIVKEIFLLQQNPPGREFLNLYFPNIRQRRKQARRKETKRRCKCRAQIRNPEHHCNRRCNEIYDSEDDGPQPVITPHHPCPDRKVPLRIEYSNTTPAEMQDKLTLPTTSKSLNAILCPVTAEETETQHRQLARTESDQYRRTQQTAHVSGVDATGTELRKPGQTRYHPYAQERRSTVAQHHNQSNGMVHHSDSSRFHSYLAEERCSFQSYGQGVSDELSGYVYFSPPTTPSVRTGDLMSDNGTSSSRASSPSTTEGRAERYEGKSSTSGCKRLDETCLGSPHYHSLRSSAPSCSDNPVLNISGLNHKLNCCSSSGDYLPPSVSKNEYIDGQSTCSISRSACYSGCYRTLMSRASSPAPKLRPLTRDGFGHFVTDDFYESDCSSEGL